MTSIYKIQSLVKPERCYIGSAVDIKKRWEKHLWELRKGVHSNQKLQRHYFKYGKNDLQFSILLGCEKEDLLKMEQYFLDVYNPWFNILKIAGSHLGAKRSDLMKEKMRKISKGRHLSEESKQKIREARKNQINTVKGKHWKVSELGCINMANAHIGLKRSIESRLKMSIASKGKPKSKEHRKNMCKPRTEEHKQKMREGWAKRKLRLVK